MKITMTGSSGLVGSVLMENLIADGHEVQCCHKDDAISALKKSDIFIHCARDINNILHDDSGDWYGSWRYEFEVDLVYPDRCINHLLKLGELKQIIIISSIFGIKPTIESPIHYGICKAAQIHYVKELAVKLAPRVRANCVTYGGIWSDRQTLSQRETYYEKTLTNDMLHRRNLYSPIKLLIENNEVTGQNLIIDGGFTLK
jgi:NAD(P)-dependent dehydrogenase (short-subunit alcohol dehydrogenase family)